LPAALRPVSQTMHPFPAASSFDSIGRDTQARLGWSGVRFVHL